MCRRVSQRPRTAPGAPLALSARQPTAVALALVGLFNIVGAYISGLFGKSGPRKYGLAFIYAARGVAMAQCAAAGLPLRELAARLVKKSVVGTGTADKTQVAAMVTRLLGVQAVNADAADALAIAIAAGHDGMAGFGIASSSEAGGGSETGALGSGSGGLGLERAIAAALARDAGNGRGEG